MATVRQIVRRAIHWLARLLPRSLRARVGNTSAVRKIRAWANTQPVKERYLPHRSVSSPVDGLTSDDPKGIPIELMGEKPSYRYKLEEMKRRRRLVNDVFGVRDPVMVINDKYRAYDFADDHSIDHPKVFGVYESIHNVNWDGLPDAFVLKTRMGSSNVGVKALVTEGPGLFRDLMRGQTWTLDQIYADQAQKESQGLVSRGLLAEELVLKSGEMAVADDWKFYCFDGKVGLSMQRDLKGSGDPAQWRFKFRDRNWNDLGPVKFIDRLDDSLALPEDPASLLDVAERLSAAVARPFIRIDLFESDRGPLLGEFTPAPGPPEVFVAEIDEMLGAMWEYAEAEHFARAIRTGIWSHLKM